MSSPTPKPFGFTASYEPAEHDGDTAGWIVTLPEQYDCWTITAPSYYEPRVTKPQAVAEFRRFIAEAQQLLALIEAAPDEFDAVTRIAAARTAVPDDLEANWAPLRAVLPLEGCDPWMWMGRRVEGDRVIEQYKHRYTRRYLNLDQDGQAWTWQTGRIVAAGCGFDCAARDTDADHVHKLPRYAAERLDVATALEWALS